jgi:ATP-dependent RNA helicase DeaD
MRDGRARVCVATDVAARGIDLPSLELVIHADLPGNREALLHRSGRTGRAGRKGISALVVPHRARRRAEALLASAGVSATWSAPPSPAEILAADDARILADPTLAEPVMAEEEALVAALLERHGPERVAAAFLRRLRRGLAAPEDLVDLAGSDTVRPPRDAFGPSAWFTLSIGRRQKAEPRWLLPLICGAGGLSRRDVGAIRMQRDVTFVEIAAERADAFLAGLGPERTLENGIAVTRSDGPPAAGEPHRPTWRPPTGSERPERAGDGKRRSPRAASSGAPKRRPKDR